MSKHELKIGTTLRYLGRPFEGFNKMITKAIFLGYDCSGWNSIWIEYLGAPRLVALADIAVDEE
ncbi:hypothetical protein FPZ42_12075 [Mucilaginibacter achroorhodeus]|uniref:Uncharacterized protein n=1 Tax=Mucilaginibacter achroorhodeus TaxID=2599294 RepID=A0A563U142_9SPHI|nr:MULTISPECIES: hypothetical protein [Mucilaginibacter]QXV67463.1 hypothetical protein INP83_10370 [Mucilaginibacter sp. 21P]TWR25338.1 hypothetical protein FPZ42_12075 [Mucilaginibacter achroorhodeus]